MASATLPSPLADGRALIALSRIKVVDGFNPRTSMEQSELERLAGSLREVGMLQPVLLGPADANGDHPLIAGGRRHAAAVLAAMVEIPYVLDTRPDAGTRLDAALIENIVRADLTPVQEARGVERMLAEGFTRRGVAGRLGKPQGWVRDRLALLALPDGLHPLIEDGSIPLKAVKGLVALATVHRGLAALAVDTVIGSLADGTEPWTWEQLAEDPVDVVTRDLDASDVSALPDDVFLVARSRPTGYPVSRFTLTGPAAAALPRLCELTGSPPESCEVFLGKHAVAAAGALKATIGSRHGWVTLIVGQDVADQLASDYITRALALSEAKAREAQAAQHAQVGPPPRGAGATGSGSLPAPVASASGGSASPEPGPSAELLAEQRRGERAAEQAARVKAQERNLVLGAAVYARLSKLKVDERVVKILAAIDVAGDLAQIAARGARYGFPGWVTEQTANGKVKRTYLQPADAERDANAYLRGAHSVGDHAGRLLALIVMAQLADETAVAMSNRVNYAITPSYCVPGVDRGLPWRGDVGSLIEAIAIERLPEDLMAPLVERRAAERRDAEAAREATDAKDAAAQVLLERLPVLDARAREAAAEAFRAEHGGHWKLADALRAAIRADQDAVIARQNAETAQVAPAQVAPAQAIEADEARHAAEVDEVDDGEARGDSTDASPAPGAGTRRAQALALITGRPGITIPELAAAMDVRQNSLHRVLADLARRGAVVKRGRGWHPVADGENRDR